MKIRAQHILKAIVIVLSFNAGSTVAAQDPRAGAKHARAEYVGAEGTPNGIVYYAFLSTLTYLATRNREDAVHRVLDSLVLSHDEDGTSQAESLFTSFENSYLALHSEVARMEAKTLCPQGRTSRSKEQVYESFHKSEDKKELIAAKHLNRLHKELSNDDYQRLLSYLAYSKQSFYYLKTDYAAKYADMPSIDVRDDVETICAKIGVAN